MSRAAARRGLPVMTAGVAAPADRRFRRPDVRPARRRRIGQWVWRAGRVALAGLVVLGAAAWGAHLLLGSQLLAVSHLVVRGNARLSTGEVQSLLNGLAGQNILRVDFASYRQRLLDSPWVADATLWRVLPSTVDVQIVERVPMAVARVGQQMYLVDETGVIIDEFGPQYRDFDLPIVDGLVRKASKTAGAPVDPASVALTGRFLDALRPEADLRRRVSQIDVSDGRDLVALLNDSPVLLHLGDTRFVERLNTYLDIAPTLAQQFKDIDFVDLRFDEHVVVGAHGRVKAAVSKSGR
ncbi:MAG TPA: FtsQ-type POTRA domain-containing protein [Vicinamibacterales bacterium]|nr:FtsQ-type POTRA domain-containing protein [Vicinamibacterales bacterium]